jgi:folate-binding protein YgfZ
MQSAITTRHEPAAPGRLQHLGVLRVAGPDAAAFLQGQISADTRRLAAGTPLLAAYCTPQGRVIAVLRLLPHTAGILAILPRELVEPVAGRLRRYVLRSKVRIEDASDELAAAGHFGSAALHAATLRIPDAQHPYVETDGIGVAGAGDDARYWVVGPATRLAELELGGAPADADRIERDWRLADVAAGLPQVYASTSEAFVAQMLNLDLLDGISFKKGCFTGQEIIARTQHLGRIKRRMLRLRLKDAAWSIGGAVRLADGRTGRLTELVRSGDQFAALAVLPIDAASKDGEFEPPPAAVDSPPAVLAADAAELPLPYPLTAASS